MFTHCLLLAALIFSAYPRSAERQRGVAPTRDVTIVDRLRSELLSVLDKEAVPADDGRVPPRPVAYLTRASGVRPGFANGLSAPQPTLRRGGACWWIWLVFGISVCQ
jgi:hypothetical protein